MSTRCSYTVIDYLSSDECLVILDDNSGRMSVTNDAEAVVEELHSRGMLPTGRRLEHFDSEGHRDQLLVLDGVFAGFAPARKD